MKYNHFKVKSVFLCLLSTLLLTGCWQEELPAETNPSLIGEEELTPVENHTILPEHFSLPYNPGQSLDPVTCPDGMQQVVSSLMYEGLFRLSPEFEPEPWLCTSYTYDPETYTYVFSLRPSIVFSDGTPLTGTDIKATLERARKSDRYSSRLSSLTSITADETTVTITLSSSHTAFPVLLDIPIVKAGSEQDAAPIGTGPYLFSAETTGAWLIANQSWWQPESQPTDRIALVEAADQDTKLYRFTSHDVQLITADLTGTSPIRATGNISYQDTTTTILQYLGCNTAVAPMDNAAFRRALSAGINRAQISNAFLSGHSIAAQFPVSPASVLYPSELEQNYTLDAFTSALAESGYVAERTLSLLVNEENSFKVSVAQHLAESFSTAGIPMEARVLPWADYMAALAAGDFDLYYGEVKLSADWNLTNLLSSGGTMNYIGWSNAQTDHLISSCLSATDRAAAMQTLCTHLQQHAPILPLCFKSTSILMQTDVVDGLTPTMTQPFYGMEQGFIHFQTA